MPALPDYRDDPEHYEIEQRSRPDEMLMIEVACQKAAEWLDGCSQAYVLDLCCGTGLSTRCLAEHPNVAGVTGVDNCRSYLAYARRVLAGCRVRPNLIEHDAVTLGAEEMGRVHWNLVMMASAYHHIENHRKVRFLRQVRDMIGTSGRAILAENILPNYAEGRPTEYRAAVEIFYWEVLKTARANNPELPVHVESLIKRVAQYGYDGDYEYKVCMPVLQRHLEDAGLSIVEKIKIWPGDISALGEDGGNFVFIVKASLGG